MTYNSIPENVSRETLADLEKYVALIEKWNPRINLVSKKSLDEIWERHIWDSWQIVNYASNEGSNWLDLGSGGGLPGILVAIHAKHFIPSRMVLLMESDARKGQFLRTVIRELSLNAKVVTKRIEEADSCRADIISARALASLDVLLGFAAHHIASDGVLLVHKGANFQAEIDQARHKWDFDLTIHPSITEKSAAILEIGSITYE